jgi:hypothetical protein
VAKSAKGKAKRRRTMRFRGDIAFEPSEQRVGDSWIEINADQIRFGSRRRAPRVVRREDLQAIETRRAWLLVPLDLRFSRTELHFVVRAQVYDRQRFIPVRTRRVQRALRDAGWPITRGARRCLWRKREHDYGRPTVNAPPAPGISSS